MHTGLLPGFHGLCRAIHQERSKTETIGDRQIQRELQVYVDREILQRKWEEMDERDREKQIEKDRDR